MSSQAPWSRCVWGAFVVLGLGCNDAKTVDPQTPAATLEPPGAVDPPEPEPDPEPEPESEPVPATPMTPDPAPQIHALGIDDAAFFDGGTSKAMAVARRELRKGGVRVLRIDAPFVVDTATQSSLPVHGVFAREDSDAADLEQSSIVVAVDVTNNAFHAGTALRSSKLSGKGGGSKEGSKAGAKADATQAAFVASSFDLDVFERLPELQRKGVNVQLYVVQQGLLSNGTRCALSGTGTHAAQGLPTKLAANLEEHADSPKAPAGGGVVLSVPGEAVSEPGASVVLRGAVRARGESARVFLMATSDKASGPFSFVVDVPLREGVGHFNVDVVGDEGPPKRPAQWHWYAFMGESSAGPADLLLTPGAPW
ncbi:MAG: hypothetical protein ACRBN8_11705 [Nannocystales bacterium]